MKWLNKLIRKVVKGSIKEITNEEKVKVLLEQWDNLQNNLNRISNALELIAGKKEIIIKQSNKETQVIKKRLVNKVMRLLNKHRSSEEDSLYMSKERFDEFVNMIEMLMGLDNDKELTRVGLEDD